MHDVTHKCKHAAPTVTGRHSVFTGRMKKKKKNNSMYIAKQQMFSPCSLSVVGRLQPLLLPHTGTKMSGGKRILSEPRVTVAPTLTPITLGHGRNISECVASRGRHIEPPRAHSPVWAPSV